LQTQTVVDTMTATITDQYTQLQTITDVATQTQTVVETSVVAETALAQCLGQCQSQWGLSSGNGNSYNTYASPSASYTLTTTAAGSYATQNPPHMMSSDAMSSSMYGASAMSSGSYASSAPPMASASGMSSSAAAGASTTGCAGCSD
jgi:hypothetical protein